MPPKPAPEAFPRSVDVNRVVATARMRGDSAEDTRLLRVMLSEAKNFLQSFSWCRRVARTYFGKGIGGTVAVFLFQIIPAEKEVDTWLWVVVGDLPPAYLVVDGNSDPATALRSYVREMARWVRAVKQRKSVRNLIPVNVPTTLAWARRLEKRLRFVETKIIPAFKEC